MYGMNGVVICALTSLGFRSVCVPIVIPHYVAPGAILTAEVNIVWCSSTLVVQTGYWVAVLIFRRTHRKQICDTASTIVPWVALSMAPDWRGEATLDIDIVVVVAIASFEVGLDEGVVIAVRANLSRVVVRRDSHIQLGA